MKTKKTSAKEKSKKDKMDLIIYPGMGFVPIKKNKTKKKGS